MLIHKKVRTVSHVLTTTTTAVTLEFFIVPQIFTAFKIESELVLLYDTLALDQMKVSIDLT